MKPGLICQSFLANFHSVAEPAYVLSQHTAKTRIAPDHGTRCVQPHLNRAELFPAVARRARNQHRIRPRRARDVRRLRLTGRFGGLIRHGAVVEKIAQCPGLDGKIDVFGDIARGLGNPQRIQLGGDHADNIATGVVQGPAAVARLNRRADLQGSGYRYAPPPRS
jgi:hypothetical protein